MTRQEHLEFCKKCTKRKFDLKQGIICKLTGKIADFEGACEHYNQDEFIIETEKRSAIENDEITYYLNEHAIIKLKLHQDFYFALIGGLLAMLVTAILWAVISVTAKFQIGFMAIGVGLLVGFSVQFFGAGIEKKFGYLGAALSLLGCLLGNLFTQVGFIAQEQSLGFFETLSYLNLPLIFNILIESFNPIDLLFYAFALFEGYKLSFRKISNKLIADLKSDKNDGQPQNSKLRLPLAIISIAVILIFVYKTSRGINDFKTYYYESGIKMSEGNLKKSKTHGKWIYFYENGNIQAIANYSNGIADGPWQWFSESGVIIRTGEYKLGLEHGIWKSYYENGIVTDSGRYHDGRLDGFWLYNFENGKTSQSGYYKSDQPDSIWKVHYISGNLKSAGSMKNGKPSGDWMSYYANGQSFEEINYRDDSITINNSWDSLGNPQVINGNGTYFDYHNNSKVHSTGKVENGRRAGNWTVYYSNGNVNSESFYDSNTERIINSWDISGNMYVKEGAGYYMSYYDDETSKFEYGEIKNGYRSGQWFIYFLSNGKVFQEIYYVKGQLTGKQKVYYESGQLYTDGELKNDNKEGLWHWYFENGQTQCTVNYINDKKEGKQVFYNENGEKIKIEFYKKGDLVKIQTL